MMTDKPELVNALATVLSDAIVFTNQAQGAHWNVVGHDFHQYHAFFAEIYEDVEDSIDPLAENIRKLGAMAPYRLQDFARLSNIDDSTECGSTTSELTSYLHASNEIMIEDINYAFALANAMNEQGIADFLAARDDMHKKWRWQLGASLYTGSHSED